MRTSWRRGLAFSSLLLVLPGNLPIQAQASLDLQQRIAVVREQQRAAQNAAALTGTTTTGSRILDTVDLQGAGFRDAVRWWSEASGINVVIDWRAMERRGIDTNAPIHLELRQVPRKTVFDLILEQASPAGAPELRLIVEAHPRYLQVFPKEVADTRLMTRFYDVADLLHAVPSFNNAPAFSLTDALSGSGSGSGGGGGRSDLFEEDDREENDADDSRQAQAEQLADAIRRTVEPSLWLGGPTGRGSATIIAREHRLIIRAPQYVHRQIGKALPKRRASIPIGAALTGTDVRRSTSIRPWDQPNRHHTGLGVSSVQRGPTEPSVAAVGE